MPDTDYSAKRARRARLIEQHGTATPYSNLQALAQLGLDVPADDVSSWLYRDQRAADAYAASNAQHNGIPTLGTFVTDAGVVGVLDLRPALAALRRRPA